MEERNVGTKRTSLEQGITSAKVPTIMLDEGSVSYAINHIKITP